MKGGERSAGYRDAGHCRIFSGGDVSIAKMGGENRWSIINVKGVIAMTLLAAGAAAMFVYLTYALLNPEKF